MMGLPTPASPEEQLRLALEEAFRHADLTIEQLWTRYFALGGNLDLVDVEGHLAGLMPLPSVERDMLAHAVNERLDEVRWQRRVPYTHAIRQRPPTSGPLAALVQLLEGARLAPPERLAALAGSAARALDVDVAVHLVDHEQRRLHRLAPSGQREGAPLSVDGTLAGRVFQMARALPSEAGEQPRLWVPLLDGADRLGVLEVGLHASGDLYDPALREQCAWLAAQLGHLIGSMGRYGDELDCARRTAARTPSAELIHTQLPPLTAATSAFVLAARIEPSYEAGGDAFDYALSANSVSLAVFDAMGHGMAAALMAAAALSSYRSARRDGRNLSDQARAVDDVLADHFSSGAFVTGVLAELDVGSGRLRYVNAGHPFPLLLRGGKVVKALGAGRRLPLGLAGRELTVGEEALQPGDWLALYTDGITEARDAAGRWFGESRLTDFLTRAAAAAQPPPETVRRLTHAVLDHQGGALQDDASILLACWRLGESS